MRRFLVPVDGSQCSLRAVRHAIAIAKSGDKAEVHLVHGHEEPLIYGEIAVYVPREKLDAMQRQHSEDLLSRAEPLLAEAGVPYAKHVVVGPIGERIAELADTLGCEAIILGTHGMTAVGKFLMGSVAAKIVHASRVPVTLVK